MRTNKPPPDELVAKAAELRAGGSSWEAVAAAVGRAADAVRRWPTLYPGPWQKAFRAAERQFVAEATAEAVLVLRQHLRSDDEQLSQDAAQRLVQLRVALARQRKAKKRDADASAAGELQRVAAYLEALPDAERDQILDDLVAEAVAGRAATGGAEEAGGAPVA
jgi:hypothetical protein